MTSLKDGVAIAPSILAGDFAALGAECAAMEASGADVIHVDVMDGHFAPNITFGPPMVAALRRHVRTVMDVHLMVEPADTYLEAFAKAGADVLTVHAEASRHLDRTLQAVRGLGCGAGVALNPATPPEAVAWVLDRVDLVCMMTVNPGFGGQTFLHGQLPKIAALRALIGDRPIRIEIDGGVTVDTAPACVAAGADWLVAGSAAFRGGSVAQPAAYRTNIAALRVAAEGAAA
jgi:ribulose-phosphate 3-epimerase